MYSGISAPTFRRAVCDCIRIGKVRRWTRILQLRAPGGLSSRQSRFCRYDWRRTGGDGEAVNRGAKEAGGVSLGCNIQLPVEQQPNAFLDSWVEFRYFFVRKLMLAKYSYAFIALPGGLGTLDEFFEIATLIQNGKVKRFPLVLMGRDYWQPLMSMLQGMVSKGTLDSEDVGRIIFSDSPNDVATIIREQGLKEFGLTYGPRLRRSWFLFERRL